MRARDEREGDTMSKPWAIYIRVSTGQQVDGFSLDAQTEKLVAFAETEGWPWDVFEDPGVSGETLDRPGLMKMFQAIDRGDVGGVLVVDESRLGRTTWVSTIIRDRFARAGVRLAIPGRGVFDLTDPSTAFMAEILGSAASLEQKLRTQKMKAGLRATAGAGYWPGGLAPYGYRLVPSDDGKHTKLAINDEEAKVLRLVADLIVNKGYTTYSAATHLNGVGIRTRKSRPWRHPNLAGQLRKTHTTGLFLYDPKGESVPISIPAIFTQDEWDALRKAIRGEPRPHRLNRLYPLTGKGRVHLRCACGRNFYGFSDRSSKKGPRYECSGNEPTLGDHRCPHRPRITRADALEDAVWDLVVAAITDPGCLTRLATDYVTAISDVTPNEVAGLERRLGKLQSQETRLVRRLAEDDLHVEATERALDEVATERNTVEKELERLQEAQQGALSTESVPEAVERLSALAQSRLADPTIELMAEVFDLLQVDLIRVEGRTFEGVARIPIPDPDSRGEVWEGAPPGHAPPQQQSDPDGGGVRAAAAPAP
jgi:DNA invertase Pin-like site-specific DNA recombinase